MDTVFRNFYRNFYLRTGGFIPTKPLNQAIFPGDFFQVINGEIFVFDNIFRKGLVPHDNVQFGSGIKQNPAGWNFSDGVTKPYSGRGTGQGPVGGEFQFSKQILAFSQKGSFIFRSNEPESVKILNWSELEEQLIIKLTQTIYSFRELYLVTETAAPSNWTLAIAGSDKAELEIATDEENFGLADIFGHETSKTIQSKDIEYYHRQEKRKPVFFKAKKLAVRKDKLEVYIQELITNRSSSPGWYTQFFDYGLEHEPVYSIPVIENAQTSILDMMQSGQLNPHTALLYFTWADANLDDIEKLV